MSIAVDRKLGGSGGGVCLTAGLQWASFPNRATPPIVEPMDPITGWPGVVRSGTLAGAVSTVVFTVVHDILISNIWPMLVPMLIAGIGSGLCLAWSYARLARRRSLPGWLGYNLTYLTMFGLLGAVSIAIFEPVTTVGALIAGGRPPDGLFAQALPMTVVFAVAGAALVTWMFGRSLAGFGAAIVTMTVLTLTLGTNIAIIGLVEFSGGTWYLVGEFFALTALLGAVFAVTFAILERTALTAVELRS